MRLIGVAAALLVAIVLAAAPTAAQGRLVFVNTSEDLPGDSAHCLPGQLCPLRSAIERAADGATIRACYDRTEIAEGKVPKGKACPGAAKPLTTADPGYDAATGKWVFAFGQDIPFTLSTAAKLDFTLDIDGWAGPQDNKIIIDPGDFKMPHAVIIEGSGSTLKGIEFRGDFTNGAITIRAGLGGGGTIGDNQLGPGLIFGGIPGIGVRLSGPEVKRTKFVGNWCGITGDGTVHSAMRDDCVEIGDGVSETRVGGLEPGERNVFAGSNIGAGVILQGNRTVGNIIQGNWIGLDATGKKLGNEAGITIKQGARDTQILDNLISGNDQSGISVFDNSAGTVIRDNIIGEGPDGIVCMGNGNYGVSMTGQVTGSIIEQNRMACNAKGGILISGSGSQRNRVSRNSITNNNNDAVRVAGGANRSSPMPTISNAASGNVRGQACPGCTVEVFSDPGDEADTYEGQVQADGSTGYFEFQKAEGFKHNFVKVIGTDPNGNSSGLSLKRAVPAPRSPTPIRATNTPPATTEVPPTAGTPGTPGTAQTPTATPTTQVLRDLYVPALYKAHAAP